MLRVHESKQGGESGGISVFARSSESEKNERNDQVSKELYVQTRVRKRISYEEKKEHAPTIYRRKCEDLNKKNNKSYPG